MSARAEILARALERTANGFDPARDKATTPYPVLTFDVDADGEVVVATTKHTQFGFAAFRCVLSARGQTASRAIRQCGFAGAFLLAGLIRERDLDVSDPAALFAALLDEVDAEVAAIRAAVANLPGRRGLARCVGAYAVETDEASRRRLWPFNGGSWTSTRPSTRDGELIRALGWLAILLDDLGA